MTMLWPSACPPQHALLKNSMEDALGAYISNILDAFASAGVDVAGPLESQDYPKGTAPKHAAPDHLFEDEDMPALEDGSDSEMDEKVGGVAGATCLPSRSSIILKYVVEPKGTAPKHAAPDHLFEDEDMPALEDASDSEIDEEVGGVAGATCLPSRSSIILKYVVVGAKNGDGGGLVDASQNTTKKFLEGVAENAKIVGNPSQRDHQCSGSYPIVFENLGCHYCVQCAL